MNEWFEFLKPSNIGAVVLVFMILQLHHQNEVYQQKKKLLVFEVVHYMWVEIMPEQQVLITPFKKNPYVGTLKIFDSRWLQFTNEIKTPY